MQTNTNLCNVIHAREQEDLTLDQAIKEILSDKQVLARILKFTLKEFEKAEIEDIIPCIEGTPEVAAIPLEPGLTNNRDKLWGASTESYHAGEGIAYFDIRFAAIAPECKIRIIINVEAQKSSDPGKLGYHVENRMVFYISRMISAQKNTEFTNDHYDQIKKVKSIWLCMDCDEDFIVRYPFEPSIMYGKPDRALVGGLIEGVIVGIRTRKDIAASKNHLIAMLEDLLKTESAAAKIKKLKERYGLRMTDELERGVNQMCNYSEMIREQAAIQATIETMITCGKKKDEVIELLQRKFNLAEKEANECYDQYVCALA